MGVDVGWRVGCWAAEKIVLGGRYVIAIALWTWVKSRLVGRLAMVISPAALVVVYAGRLIVTMLSVIAGL